jgi:hypothetical protein
MKELPDEKILLEMLEEFKQAEQAARELCELSTAIAWKYQKKVSQLQRDRSASSTTEPTLNN